jgi:hypothetical protein
MRVIAHEELPDGRLLVHTGKVSVLVPSGFPRQPSQDADMHVCIRRDPATGALQPVCLFVPGQA